MMELVSDGKRNKWKFEVEAEKVLEGAIRQKDFRLGRVKWWQDAKAKVVGLIKEDGIEITESMAAQLSNYNTMAMGPQVVIKTEYQKQLTECHNKIQQHQKAADEYESWIQILSNFQGKTLKLTHGDWMYFFRTS